MTREEAIERIKSRYDKWALDDKDLEAIQCIFPEPTESEDERIRKSIERAVRGFITNPIEADELLAWLEKQLNALRVEKAMREIEEKAKAFTEAHKGESADEILAQMRGEERSEDERIIEGFYTLIHGIRRDGGLTLNKVPLDKCETWLEKQKEQKPAEINEYEIIKKHITGDSLSSEVNKRLKECGWYVTDEKPAEWSEEEEQLLNTWLFIIDENEWRMDANFCEDTREFIARLKSLHPQPKQEWSEDIIQKAVKEVGLTQHQIDWFKTNVFPPKQGWSEEDENMLNSCISSIEEAKENRYYYRETDGDTSYDHEISWLRSLRPSWKPSEEQMEAFRKYLEDFQARAEAAVGGWNNFDVMIRLYEQLKKLI